MTMEKKPHEENTSIRYTKINQVMFNDELYDYTEHPDGSKTLYKEKDENGFKITIHVSGDLEDHEQGKQAVEDFFVKGIL
ncbi:hypothetical protein ACQCN2_09480 [Brevibacillus ginsengisoli]|uniref:hypothetical protein n=1 Tax=Brevibacillus ginsengisoli TaxID=363854 RepID=UPI003CF3CE38